MANKLSKMMPKSTSSNLAVDCSPPRQTKAQQDERRRWQAEDALRTITRAKEIERDRKLMSDVKCLAREQMKSLSSVTSSKKK